MKQVRTLSVGETESGMKLWQFLSRACRGASRTLFFRWARTGQVRINGRRAQVDVRLSTGDSVRIPPFEAEESEMPAAMDYKKILIFEDQDLLVLNKPSGIAVHKGTGHIGLIEQLAGAGLFRPVPVHRLDLPTSGVLVIAKNFRTLKALKENWGQAEKFYLALATDSRQLIPSGRTLELRDRLAERADGPKMEISATGKLALLRLRRLSVKGEQTLIMIRLFTGRTHQIRVQMANFGAPLTGDARYFRSGELFLHCRKIVIPIQGEKKTFKAPLPPGFARKITEITGKIDDLAVK
ncbi:MAG: RluA family pseudouridine synthase [Candidatus Wallbacteria bacterium]|nr:RluA family pseudouridine synthase [Candidatus Wallbacteria bacterium]